MLISMLSCFKINENEYVPCHHLQGDLPFQEPLVAFCFLLQVDYFFLLQMPDQLLRFSAPEGVVLPLQLLQSPPVTHNTQFLLLKS